MPLHPLTNFEKIGYYQNETKFNGVYWMNSLPRMNEGELINATWQVQIKWNSLNSYVCEYQYILIVFELNTFQKKLQNS